LEKLDAFLGKHMAVLIVAFVLVGITFPDVFSPINDRTVALFAFMTFAKLTMLVLVLVNATGCAPFLRSVTPALVKVICAVFALCLLGFFLGYRAALLMKVDFPTAVTMSLNSGIRNIAAGSVLAIQYFPGDVLFPVAFSPLFLQATTAVIVKILHATKGGKEFDRQAESAK
jgi:predicted Na+-dependent transporter